MKNGVLIVAVKKNTARNFDDRRLYKMIKLDLFKKIWLSENAMDATCQYKDGTFQSVLDFPVLFILNIRQRYESNTIIFAKKRRFTLSLRNFMLPTQKRNFPDD